MRVQAFATEACLAASILMVLAGCATTESPTAPPQAPSAQADTLPPDTIGAIVREMGPGLSANIAVMHGVSTRPVGQIDPRKIAADQIAVVLAENAGLEIFQNPQYLFLAPSEYRLLNSMNLAAMASHQTALPKAAVAIGADTPLYDAFALLSRALNTTIVADNAVAAARCGELSLPSIDGLDAIEAVLKSARLDQNAFRVEADDSYILIHSVNNPPRADVVPHNDVLDQNVREMLKRRVTLQLPNAEGPNQIGAYASAQSLGAVLPSLTEQLKIQVTAAPQLLRFPVNPCVMTNVTVETAMKLLINQWLAQDFIVEVRENSLHLRPAD